MIAKFLILTLFILLTLSLILPCRQAVSDTLPSYPFSPVLKQDASAVKPKPPWTLRSIGLQTMAVLTGKYHAGFGYGGRMTAKMFDEYTNIITEIGFWGATRDTVDVAVLGLQETIAYELSKSDKFRGFAGICLGYFYLYKTETSYYDGRMITRESKSNSFDVLFTYGVVYTMSEEKTLLLQVKYGITELSDELHIIAGLNFNPRRLRREQ